MIRLEKPRPLSQRERDVLEYLLSLDFPGVSELREQAKHVSVVAESDHCPTIDLVVDHSKAKPAKVSDILPVTTYTKDDVNFVHVNLFVRDGWLSEIDVGHYDYIPSELPPPDELVPPREIQWHASEESSR